MRINHQLLNSLLLVVLITFFSSIKVAGQANYFVPTKIPKSAYKLDLKFDFQSAILSGKGKLTFYNSGNRPIEMIALGYALNDHQLLRLIQGDKELEAYSSEENKQLNNPVYFVLDEPVSGGDSLVLKIEFKRRLFANKNPSYFENDDLIPRLWWDGIATSESFNIKLNPLSGYTIAMSGRLNQKTGYYENENVKDFGFFFSKNHDVIEEEIAGVLVRVIHPKNDTKVAEIALQTAREAIPFYINLMGSYPYSFLNILPGGPGVWGGYPFASGMVVIHGMQFFDKGTLRHWRWITGHEIGHEYWGEFVIDGNNPSWLWIALGIYADWEFSKKIGLSDWQHRHWANLYLEGVEKGYNTTFDIRPSEEANLDFDRGNYVIHAKGFSFIAALESVMGKENFHAAYKATLEAFGGDRLDFKDFQRICEKHAGENLNWFFEPWVRTNDFLSASVLKTVTEKVENGYSSVVTISHKGDLIMPVPVYAIFEDGSLEIKMSSRLSRRSTLEFQSSGKLIGASIDPSGYLANMTDPSEPILDEVISDIKMLPYSGAGENAYRIYLKARKLDAQEIGKYWNKLGLTLFDGGYYSQSESAFRSATQYAGDERKFINYCWLGHLQDVRSKRSAAISSYNKALEVWDDDSYSHSQYNMQVNKKWVEERLQTPFSLGEPLSW